MAAQVARYLRNELAQLCKDYKISAWLSEHVQESFVFKPTPKNRRQGPVFTVKSDEQKLHISTAMLKHGLFVPHHTPARNLIEILLPFAYLAHTKHKLILPEITAEEALGRPQLNKLRIANEAKLTVEVTAQLQDDKFAITFDVDGKDLKHHGKGWPIANELDDYIERHILYPLSNKKQKLEKTHAELELHFKKLGLCVQEAEKYDPDIHDTKIWTEVGTFTLEQIADGHPELCEFQPYAHGSSVPIVTVQKYFSAVLTFKPEKKLALSTPDNSELQSEVELD